MSSNDRTYSEKRDFIRMRVETPVIIEYASRQFTGLCLDLSSSGLQVEIAAPLPLGAHVRVIIESAHDALPNFDADAEVVRVDVLENSLQLLGLTILALR